MKYLIALVLSLGVAVGQQHPTISAYTLTEADCNPLSMLMLFRPTGFVCKPSVNVVINGLGPEVTGYDVEIVLHGAPSPMRVYLPVFNGTAEWHLDGNTSKVDRVSVIPQSAASPAITQVF